MPLIRFLLGSGVLGYPEQRLRTPARLVGDHHVPRAGASAARRAPGSRRRRRSSGRRRAVV